MSRPSHNIDVKLIGLGKKCMVSRGIANISIRAICTESGINLGMFYYYFKSKENYIRILLKSLGNDLQAYWLRESANISSPIERLKKILQINVKLCKEHRGSFETIVKDIDFQDAFYMQIWEEIHQNWENFYNTIIEDCKRKSCLSKTIDNDKLMAILVGGTMHYAKGCLGKSDAQYYKKVNEIIDLLIEKFK
jgi:AcrR family transcriptional regulator